jgi:hypothetical protein
MNNEEKLILAFILLLSFSISAYSIAKPHLLDMNSYAELLLAKEAVEGRLSSPTPMLYQLTSFIYQVWNSGGTEFNTELMLNIAKIFTIIFSLICSISFYFMLKDMFSEIAAVGGVVLLISSPPFLLIMSSGAYYADALGMCLFTLACSALFLFYHRGNYLLLLISAVVFLISGASWEMGWVMTGVVLLSLLAQLIYNWKKKFDEALAHGTAAILVTFLLSYFITPYSNVFSNMKAANLTAYLFTAPVAVVGVFAFLSWLIGRHRGRSKLGVFAASSFILSVIILLFAPFPPAFGIALFSAFAINELLELKNENLALLLFAGTLFFVSFLVSINFLDLNQAVLASAGVALTSVFIAALYRERRVVVYITFSVIMLFLLSSLSAAIITTSQRQDIAGSGADDLMSWMRENLSDNATLWAFRVSPMLEFTSGKKTYLNDTEFASFMLSNDSTTFLKERNVSHVLVDSSLFDSIEVLKTLANNTRVRIDSFRFWRRISDGTNLYGEFISVEGNIAYVQLNPLTGNPVEGNVQVVGSDGNTRLVPIKNFLMIGSGRLIYPQDNYKVNLFKLFFENVDGLKQVYTTPTGDVEVYEVVK